MSIPSASAPTWIRSVAESFAIDASRPAFWRSSVVVVSTAREIPELSLSSETCMVTIPSSASPSIQIHRRERSRRSTTRWSGSARTRRKTPVPTRRGAVVAGLAGGGLGLRRAPAAADRKIGRADAAAGAVGEEALHAPVLERVERDRREPATDAEQVPRERQCLLELAELVVHRDA